MARYKIATKTDVLRHKIAKEVFGEVEDSDGVRDVPSWEIFEKCLEQNKQIKQLQEQLALTKKALRIKLEEDWIGCPDYIIDDKFEFCLEKAKEKESE